MKEIGREGVGMLGNALYKSCGCARGLCDCESSTSKLSLAMYSVVREIERMETKVSSQEYEIARLRKKLVGMESSRDRDTQWIASRIVKEKELEVLNNNKEILLVREKMKEIINTNSEELSKEKLAQILEIYMEVDSSECFALISCIIGRGE